MVLLLVGISAFVLFENLGCPLQLVMRLILVFLILVCLMNILYFFLFFLKMECELQASFSFDFPMDDFLMDDFPSYLLIGLLLMDSLY